MSYPETLSARIADLRRRLQEIESVKLVPIGGSAVDAGDLAARELRRQIRDLEELLEEARRDDGQ